MSSIAKKVEVDYEGLTKQVEHKELRGRAREIVIKDFLKKYLPPALGVEGGEIISSKGQVSKQMDVIVFDRLHCPLLIRADEVHVFPVEGIYAIVEVKSLLESRELTDCVEKIQSVKRMPKEAYIQQKGNVIRTTTLFGKEYQYLPTIGLVFAFDSIGLDTLCNNLAKINRKLGIDLADRIDTICVLSKGIITNYRKDEKFLLTPEPGSKPCYAATNRGLLLFYLLIMNLLGQAWMPPMDMSDYAKGIGTGFKWLEE